jgi:hypothetical protein
VRPRQPVAPPAAPADTDPGLPIPRRGETALMRARALAVTGHLHDAMSALDLVRLTDPERPDADRMRAEIQRQLLALTAARGASVVRENDDGRRP